MICHCGTDGYSLLGGMDSRAASIVSTGNKVLPCASAGSDGVLSADAPITVEQRQMLKRTSQSRRPHQRRFPIMPAQSVSKAVLTSASVVAFHPLSGPLPKSRNRHFLTSLARLMLALIPSGLIYLVFRKYLVEKAGSKFVRFHSIILAVDDDLAERNSHFRFGRLRPDAPQDWQSL